MPVRRFSRRNVRGRGWGKKGYRQNGELFFQLKRSYAGYSRQYTENEYSPISELICGMLHSVLGEDPGELAENLHYEFHFRRRPLEPSDEMIMTILDGGETVHAKVFDEEGYEYNMALDGEFEAKPCRNPVARERVRYEDGHIYWVIATD